MRDEMAGSSIPSQVAGGRRWLRGSGACPSHFCGASPARVPPITAVFVCSGGFALCAAVALSPPLWACGYISTLAVSIFVG